MMWNKFRAMSGDDVLAYLAAFIVLLFPLALVLRVLEWLGVPFWKLFTWL